MEGCGKDKYDDFSEFWIGFDKSTGRTSYLFSTYNRMCGYVFTEFYKAKDIENKADMLVQVNAMRYLNMLLDEHIVELAEGNNECNN